MANAANCFSEFMQNLHLMTAAIAIAVLEYCSRPPSSRSSSIIYVFSRHYVSRAKAQRRT